MQINIIAPNQEGHGTALFENMRASGNIGDIIFIGANDKIKVSWDKAEGVAKYEVYATYCGKKFPKKPTKTTKSTSVTIKKIKDKKIDFTKNFKLYVKAYDSNGNVVGNSVHAHFAGKDHEKYKNPKDIKLGAKNGFAKKVAVTVN